MSRGNESVNHVRETDMKPHAYECESNFQKLQKFLLNFCDTFSSFSSDVLTVTYRGETQQLYFSEQNGDTHV